MNRKLDTDSQVFFYEQEFYVLSNFSSFQVGWNGILFPTAEHVYHYLKFDYPQLDNALLRSLRRQVLTARSAHDAMKVAHRNRPVVRPDWDEIKVDLMRDILREKANQHEYVRRKLLETGYRELVEDSWRDDFWGWGPNRDGINMLGKLWMEVRQELRDLESKP